MHDPLAIHGWAGIILAKCFGDVYLSVYTFWVAVKSSLERKTWVGRGRLCNRGLEQGLQQRFATRFATEVCNKVCNKVCNRGLERRVLITKASPSLGFVCLEACIKAAPHPSFTMPHASGWAAVDAQLAACERAVLGSEAAGDEEFTTERLVAAFVEKFQAESGLKFAIMNSHSVSKELYNTRHQKACQAVHSLIERGRAVYTREVVQQCEQEAKRRVKG